MRWCATVPVTVVVLALVLMPALAAAPVRAAEAAGDRPIIAVIDFQVEGVLARYNPEAGRKAADRFRSHLHPARYRVLSREDIVRALKQDNLAMVDLWAERDLLEVLAQRTGLRYAVFGAVRKHLKQWVLKAVVVDCRSGKTGPEREVTLPLEEFPREQMEALIKALGLEPAPAARSGPAVTRPALPRMRFIQARMVRAARLFWHPGGWDFDRARWALEVTLEMNAALLEGRKLTSQERTLLTNAQLGDSVVLLDHSDFQLLDSKGRGKKCPGDWYPGYDAATRVPDPYLEGDRKVAGVERLAWKSMGGSVRRYFYDASRPLVLVSLVFPGVGPTEARSIRYRDWQPVRIGHVVTPLKPVRPAPGGPGAMRILALRQVQANPVEARAGKWEAGPPADALQVTLALSAAHLELEVIDADEKASLLPCPAGDYVARIDPKEVVLRTRSGRDVTAPRNWTTGLTPGQTLSTIDWRGTGPKGLLWRTAPDLVRICYAPAPDAAVVVTILFPGVRADEVDWIRYRNWAPVRP